MDDLARFYANTRIADGRTGCWEWTGPRPGSSTQSRHYPSMVLRSGTTAYVHRFAYQQLVGEIPRDHRLVRTCETEMCVNPWHHQVMTRAESSRLTRGREHFNGVRHAREKTAQRERESDDGSCVHYWVIDSPSGSRYSRGRCKNCGRVREDFRNTLSEDEGEPTKSPGRPRKGDKGRAWRTMNLS